MDPSVALDLLTSDPTPDLVRRHHRGWLGLHSPFEQAAESAAWAEVGPIWRTGARSGRTEGTSDNGGLATVRLRASPADGRHLTVRAMVQRSMRPQMVSCGTEALEAEYHVIQLDVGVVTDR